MYKTLHNDLNYLRKNYRYCILYFFFYLTISIDPKGVAEKSNFFSIFIITQDFDKLSNFVSGHFSAELEEIELSVKGWNWGSTQFNGELKTVYNTLYSIVIHTCILTLIMIKLYEIKVHGQCFIKD